MTTILIILGVLIAGAGVYYYFYKEGKINDRDGDYIPDEVEDAVGKAKETAAEVKRRAKRVKEELKDVKASAKDLASQVEDVVDAAAGKKRKGRKPSAKKGSGSGRGKGRKPSARKGSGSGRGRGKSTK